MRKVNIVLMIVILLGVPGIAPAQKDIVLSITGENITEVVNRFNQSQSDYRIVLQSQQYRNWRYAINYFRFTQEKASHGSNDRIIDVAFIDNNWLMGMIQEHWLADITGKINQAENFINGLADAGTKGGRLFALPFSNKGQVLFYRRDLHQKYGLALPKTLKVLEQNALLLIKREGLSHGLTIHNSAIHLDILPFLWSNGGGIVENGKVIINHPENIETLTYLQGLVRNRVLPDAAIFKQLEGFYGNAKNLFIEGKSAYIITWNNRIADFENSPLAEKFGILPIPPLKEGQPSYSVIGSWYFTVNSYSKNKNGAIRFLNYFFEDATQLDMALKSKAFIPATRSVYDHAQLKTGNPYLQDLEVAMANMRHRLKHPNEPEINHVFENSIKEILIMGKPVKPLLDIAQHRIESICTGNNHKKQ